MNETINKDIFYRPSFEVDRNYYSDADFSEQSTEQDSIQVKPQTELTSVEEIDKKSDEVIEILLRARKALPVIPERIRKILEEIIDKTIIHTALEQDELAKIIESDRIEEEKFNKYVEDLTNAKTEDTSQNFQSNSILETNKDSINVILNKSQDVVQNSSVVSNNKNTNDITTKEDISFVEKEEDDVLLSASDNKNYATNIAAQENKDQTSLEENKTSAEMINSGIEIFDRPDLGFYFPKPTNVKVIVKPSKKNTELAREQQLRDSIYIKERFASKLNDAFQSYVYPLITVMGESGVNKVDYLNMEYQGESVEGYKLNDTHLHDTIVRNQIIVEEQTRLFEKTNNPTMLNSIFTAFDVIAQQRIQYYAEEYNPGIGNFLEMYKKDILRESRKIYDDKYFKAKSNMYKYLNSTVMLTSDILKNNFNAYASKCYLLTQDVNIFARKEHAQSEVLNETSTSSQAVK